MSDTENIGLAFALTTAAGLSTTIGALLPFFTPVTSKRILSISMGFSAGVMIYVSFVEIFYKSKQAFVDYNGQTHATLSTIGCFFGGVTLAVLLDFIVHWIDPSQAYHDISNENGLNQEGAEPLLINSNKLKSRDYGTSPSEGSPNHDTISENHTQNETEENDVPFSPEQKLQEEKVKFSQNPWKWIKDDWKGHVTEEKSKAQRLKITGAFTGLAIAIHNFPEGLATFMGTLADPTVGVALAVAIAIHNIPEGICVSMPIYHATGSRLKGFLYAFLSGVSEPLGALVGWAIISAADTPLMFAIMFGIVGGMMVYISIKELLPTAHKYDENDKVTTWSFLAGMVIMATSLVLFEY